MRGKIARAWSKNGIYGIFAPKLFFYDRPSPILTVVDDFCTIFFSFCFNVSNVIFNQIGITCQSYQAYEWGVTVPTLQNFIKLARLYDVSLDDLIEA